MAQVSKSGILVYNELKAEIGVQNARKVFTLLQGQQIYFPESIIKEFRRREIVREFQAGSSYRELARKYQYTEKHIRKLTASPKTKERPEVKQQSNLLFAL